MVQNPQQNALKNHDLTCFDFSRNMCENYKSPSEKYSEIYKKLRQEFTEEGVSYLRQHLLKAISTNSPFKLLIPDTYTTLNKVAEILLLNEFELVYWHILIESTSKAERAMNSQLLAIFTAFMAKSDLNNEYEPFEYLLETIFPNFRMNYYNWTLITDCSDVSLAQLNAKYNEMILSNKTHLYRDYDDMVNELMDMPRRKESYISEYKSDLSTIGDMENELELFEQEVLGGEHFSSIDEDMINVI
ncbi:unnamed protein product [Blepharisma stoltei]|uniref:Uncharacterized protein n=1 Tax=Blepharisma stoltei TaxID=1481888 RepID=A0AAU9J136_9CILI|nr:unnamed protein product [Blepharisma stoltei]